MPRLKLVSLVDKLGMGGPSSSISSHCFRSMSTSRSINDGVRNAERPITSFIRFDHFRFRRLMKHRLDRVVDSIQIQKSLAEG